jgi:diguanylate cyclase (GGDEF)-like protein
MNTDKNRMANSLEGLVSSLSSVWLDRLDAVDHAFQPIVDINSGVTIGFEVLLRDVDKAGFKMIPDFFDAAYQDGVLFRVDLGLRRKALSKFKKIDNYEKYKLFYNIDGRLWISHDYNEEVVDDYFMHAGIKPYSIIFELSEQQQVSLDDRMFRLRDYFKNKGYKIAVDDCGAGFSGLQTMYYAEPDFVKIDRFFIHDVAKNPKKRIFVSSIVNISHSTGAMIIAEGVETAGDYYKCREIGCDFVQGYFVARPTTDLSRLQSQYDQVREHRETDRRRYQSDDSQYINLQMTRLEPMHYDESAFDVFSKFQKMEGYGIIPIINSNQEPMGVITEKSFKSFTYSRYGRELLQNRAITGNLSRFFVKSPIADIRTPVERILELYSQDDEIEGIIIVDKMKYAGFLDANSLLKALNEKNLHMARDLNPLTKLPGNMIISEYLNNALEDNTSSYALVYFDFDNFKPFNDYNGFRRGDRVILLFSQILRQRQSNGDCFLAHIGGDDFFMGIRNLGEQEALEEIRCITERFASDVKGFYDKEDLERGYIVAKDRQDRERQFPMMTVSGVVIFLDSDRQGIIRVDEIDRILARDKKQAKQSPDKLVVEHLSS